MSSFITPINRHSHVRRSRMSAIEFALTRVDSAIGSISAGSKCLTDSGFAMHGEDLKQYIADLRGYRKVLAQLKRTMRSMEKFDSL